MYFGRIMQRSRQAPIHSRTCHPLGSHLSSALTDGAGRREGEKKKSCDMASPNVLLVRIAGRHSPGRRGTSHLPIPACAAARRRNED